MIESNFCPRCENDIESWKHIWICESNKVLMQEILVNTIVERIMRRRNCYLTIIRNYKRDMDTMLRKFKKKDLD
ncbi:hypothetical protein C1646_773897 [Rhizophagus diaphanus]|nr:hypothetical protein C1646_773897 [Rhizophagus diaphanus] [Rhizophagus sp. MUCL 43196]